MTCPFCGANRVTMTVTRECVHDFSISRDEGCHLHAEMRCEYECGSVGRSRAWIGAGRKSETVIRSLSCNGTPWINSCRIIQRKVCA